MLLQKVYSWTRLQCTKQSGAQSDVVWRYCGLKWMQLKKLRFETQPLEQSCLVSVWEVILSCYTTPFTHSLITIYLINSPVTKRVEACIRNATAKHAWIIWLDRTAIFKVKSSCISHHHRFLSSQTIPACFAIALWTHSSTRFVTGQWGVDRCHVKDWLLGWKNVSQPWRWRPFTRHLSTPH